MEFLSLDTSKLMHFNLIGAISFSTYCPGAILNYGRHEAYFEELYFRIINQLKKTLTLRKGIFFLD